MKAIRVLSVLLLIISIGIAGMYYTYDRMTSDTEAPVITCDKDEIKVSVKSDEETLLEGVTVKDNKTKDVQKSLIIEKISNFTDANTRIITYAAIDDSGNVGRCERTLVYKDYREPIFTLSRPLRFPIGSTVNILGAVGAASELDGDLSDNVKYTLGTVINATTAGSFDVEYRVMDSAGKISYLPLKIEIYDANRERIEVVLSEYLIYLPINSSFDPNTYYVGSAIEGTLSVKSNVDTSKEGVYTVDYQVDGTNSIGKSRLVVVVTK